MGSGILAAVTLALCALSVLALPAKHLDGKHKLEILKLHKPTGVHPQGFDELLAEFFNTYLDTYDLIWDAQPEVEKLLANYTNIVTQARDKTYTTMDEITYFFGQNWFSLNPDDALEDTALLIDVTVVRSTLLLTKAAKAIEDIVAKDAADLLPALKTINKRVAGDIEKRLEPLITLVREVLP